MTPEQRLLTNLKAAVGPSALTVYQGIVVSVEDITCTVRFGSAEVSGIRLRASEASEEEQMLIVPRVGSAVIVGSLSGDLTQLAVLSVDSIERIEVNGGKLGGLINISDLTEKINQLVEAFNNHTHLIPSGTIVCGEYANANPVTAPAPDGKANKLNKADFEDETIKH